MADTPDVDINSFTKRPINIFTFTWSVNGTLSRSFDPWREYLDHPYIANRITNYALMRGTLKLKFLINGNAFYFGRAMAFYSALDNYDTIGSPTGKADEADLVSFSQHPKIYLDPTTSQGGEMCLPFLWHYNAVDLTTFDYTNLGRIFVRSFTTLQHANAGVDPITIQVFAWSDDMELSVPTQAPFIALSPQSGEYCENGLISKPASAVAAVAGKLTTTPTIGPYAKATQIAASTVAGVAQAFGFSKPVNQAPVHTYTPRFFGNLSSAIDLDSAQPLSMDKKVELTVDNSTLGLSGEDELNILSVAQRESYIGKLVWLTTSTAGTKLGSVGVTPVQYIDGGDFRCVSATAFAAMPFDYWRGSLKFRFQVVASGMHRGRLLLQYDPRTSGTIDTSTQYSRVIDIADERDFTITVGWGTDRPWLRVPGLYTDAIPFLANDFIANNADGTWNGLLTLSILNNLSEVNNAGAIVEVLCYVSAGDDFEVAVPVERNIKNISPWKLGIARSLKAQSGEDEATPEENAPEDPKAETEMLSVSEIGKTQSVFFGDPVPSLRSLMKRYVLVDGIQHEDFVRSRILETYPFRPFTPGPDPSGLHVTSTGASYNFTQHSWFTYCAMAYKVYRGSHRWKTFFSSVNAATPVRVSNGSSNTTTPKYNRDVVDHTVPASPSAYALMLRDGESGASAAAATVPELNPILEFTTPWYHPFRFSCARNPSVLDTSVPFGFYASNERSHQYTYTNSDRVYIERYHAMGDDVTMGMFVGLPRLYNMSPLPAAG